MRFVLRGSEGEGEGEVEVEREMTRCRGVEEVCVCAKGVWGFTC